MKILRWETSDLTESGLQLVEVGTLDTAGEASGISVSGAYAYLADRWQGLRVIDVSNPQQPVEIGSNSRLGSAVGLDVIDDYAYIADSVDGFHTVHSPVYAGFQPLGTTSDHGVTEDVVIVRGLAYLADGEEGLRILDVTNPTVPREIAVHDFGGDAVALAVRGDFAFVADRGNGGLQILPISDPTRLSEAPIFFDTPGQPNDLELLGDFIFVADGDTGVRIINIGNPSRPYEMGSIDTPGDAVGLDVVGEYLYIADSGEGMRIVNISNPISPVEVGGYNSPGDARTVAVVELFDESVPEQTGTDEAAIEVTDASQRIAYIADGSSGLHLLDVSDPGNPVLLGSYNDAEFVQDVSVVGERVFLATRQQGLLLVDTSNPADIKLLAVHDTPGLARRLFLGGNLIFVADGNRGLRIVELVDPVALNEIGFFDAPSRVASVTIVGDYAYLVDGTKGFWIADLSDPISHSYVGYHETPGEPTNLIVVENFAYISSGSAGLYVVDVSNPRAPLEAGSFDTQGTALDVAVMGRYAYLADDGGGLRILDLASPEGIAEVGSLANQFIAKSVFVEGVYAYIVDGESGLWIINVSRPEDPNVASLFGDVKDGRALVVRDNYAFIASGENGLWIVDVSRPASQQKWASFLDTPGTAVDVKISGDYAFVADGEMGFQVIYIADLSNPKIINNRESEAKAVSVAVNRYPSSDGRPENFRLYAAGLEQGLLVLNVVKLVDPVVVGFSETPGSLAFWQIAQSLFASHNSSKAIRSLIGLTLSYLLVGGIGLIFWIAFFAQFVLPLRTIEERWLAFQRLVSYTFGTHGPAIRIENGKVVQRRGEQKRRGPGVVLLDTASGAMLRKKTAFTRSVGPGVVFTNQGEYIHQEAVDLHIQVKIPPLGPQGDENPFEPRQEGESEDSFKDRQTRRIETSGLTRDGVEVVPKVSAVFRLDSEKPSPGTHFGFDSEAVRLAITREGIDIDTERHVRWYELPAYLAVDLWREYIRKFTLDQLFDPNFKSKLYDQKDKPSDGDGRSWEDRGETALELVRRMVQLRLTKEKVDELDGVGKKTGRKVTSREFRILKNMGVQVIEAPISSLAFPEQIEERLVQEWLSTWLQRALQERERIELQRSYVVREAKEDALLTFSNSTAQVIYQVLDGDNPQRPDLQESLTRLLRGTHQLCVRNNQINSRIINEDKALQDVIEWIRRQKK
ncbi:MAG: hypothetical protein PVG14_14105 [Anaerolineales bacterium]